MKKIIQIDGNSVYIGTETNDILTASLDSVNYANPKVGDIVDVYKNGEDLIIVKADSPNTSVDDPPRYTQKKSGKAKWIVIGIVAIVLIVAAVSALGGNDNQTDSPGSSESITESDSIESNDDSNKISEDSSTDSTDNMRPEFKEAMDSYEAFFNEYCSFMEKYNANPTDSSLLAEYNDIYTRYMDFTQKFDEWDTSEMNKDELNYYLEVSNRVAEKLSEIS